MTSAGAPLPNFFVVGAQKAGTSTLHRLLQQHPQAFMCDPKEPHFFSTESAWARGGDNQGRGMDWYSSLFAGAAGAIAVGEASTTYAMYPHYGGVVERLTSTVPKPQLVYIVRDPVARMRSAYLHGLASGTETRPIGTALTSDPRYLLTSSYALQLEQWLRRVPRDRILLLSLEQLRDQADEVMDRLFGFLGIDQAWRPEVLPTANVSEGKRVPRGWWRALGSTTIRLERTDWIPDWMIRLNASDSRFVRREASAGELEVPGTVAAQLRRALVPDLARLRIHWGPDSTPDWLKDES